MRWRKKHSDTNIIVKILNDFQHTDYNRNLLILCFYTCIVVSSISFFEEQSVRSDVVLVCGDKVLALVVDVVDLDDLRVLHVDSVLDEDFVPCSLILESGGVFLSQCRIRGAVDTCPC